MESGTMNRRASSVSDRASANEESAARVVRSRALAGSCDGTPRERRGYSRVLAKLEPEQQTLEMARIVRVRRDGPGAEERFKILSAVVRQRLSDELRAIDVELNQIALADGAGTRDASENAATRYEELLARRDEARLLSLLSPDDMVREVARQNRARRGAIRAVQRQLECRRNEARANKKLMEMARKIHAKGIALATSGCLDSAAATQEVRKNGANARAMACMDYRKLTREVARLSRARRFAILAGKRKRKRETDEASAALTKRTRMHRVEVMCDEDPGDLDLADVKEKELLPSTRAHIRILAKMGGPPDAEEGGACGNGGVRSGEAFREVIGTGEPEHNSGTVEGAGAGAFQVVESKAEIRKEVVGEVAGWVAGSTEVQPDGRRVVDGVATSEVKSNELEGADAGRFASAEAGLKELRTEAVAGIAGRVAVNPEARPDGRDVVNDGLVTDEREGNAAVADGTDTDGFRFAEHKVGGLLTEEVVEMAGRVAGIAEILPSRGGLVDSVRSDKAETGEVDTNAANVEEAGAGGSAFAEARLGEPPGNEVAEMSGAVAAKAELQAGARALVDGVGTGEAETGEMDRDATVVDVTDASGPPAMAPNVEELQPEAVAEVAGRVAGNAEVRAGGRALMDGLENGQTGTEVDRTAAVVDSTCVVGFAFETRLKELRAKAVAGMAEKVAGGAELQVGGSHAGRRAFAGGVGTGEAHHNPAIVERAGAYGFAFMEARLETLRAKAVADMAERVAGSAEVRPNGRTLVDVVRAGEVDRNAAGVDSTAAGGFPFIEPKMEELPTESVAEVAGRVTRDATVDRQALVDEIGAGEAGRTAAVVDGAGSGGFLLVEPKMEELPTENGRTLVDVVRAGEVDRNAAGVDSTGAGGFPFIEPKMEELLTESVAEVAGRVTYDTTVDRQALVDEIGASKAGRTAAVVDGAGSGGFLLIEPKMEELPTESASEVALTLVHDAAEVQRTVYVARAPPGDNVQADRQALVDGIGAGEACRKTAVVGGAGAGGFPSIDPKVEGLRTKAAAEMAGRVAWAAAEAQAKLGFERACHGENVTVDGQELIGGVGAGDVDPNGAVVGGARAREFASTEARRKGLGEEATGPMGRPAPLETDVIAGGGGSMSVEAYGQGRVKPEAVRRRLGEFVGFRFKGMKTLMRAAPFEFL